VEDFLSSRSFEPLVLLLVAVEWLDETRVGG
jgi:hypothetical protein